MEPEEAKETKHRRGNRGNHNRGGVQGRGRGHRGGRGGQHQNRGQAGSGLAQSISRPTTPFKYDAITLQRIRALSLDRECIPSLFPPGYGYGGNNRGARSYNGEGSRGGHGEGSRGGHRGGGHGEGCRGGHRGGGHGEGSRGGHRGGGHGDGFRGGHRGAAHGEDRGKGRFYENRCYLGFQKLEGFIEMKPDELLLMLSKDMAGLEKLFKTNLSPDYIVLLVRVLSKMCEAIMPENKGRILASVCQKDFLDKLTIYLTEIVIHEQHDKRRNKYFWENQDRFWNDLLNFYEAVINTLPNTASEVLPKLVKHSFITLSNMEREQNVTISTEVKDRFDNLQTKVVMCVEERERKKAGKYDDFPDDEPPDNFRTISLHPTATEITTRDRPFLRKNIVSGGYRSVEHYLDVQFRLLREDFVAPLRDGICNYINQQLSKERKRIFNVRIYQKVRFLKKHQIHDKMAVIVQMTVNEPRRKVKTDNSRRFMFGSLMCFTRDNFHSVIFGTVCDRDPKLLERSQVAVDTVDNFVYECDYIMVECSVYFEPYYHVLHALRLMDEDNFPLKQYIIDVESDVKPPVYLKQLEQIEYKDMQFYPLTLNTWPSARRLELDPSQYKAFQSALTKEFCVIQGPPGTGKTYIGLKIAEVLLQNHKLWNKEYGPILVICFTNHALDQFLEGICQYTKKLIRIGGQSKSVALKKFHIREMRSQFQRNRVSNTVMFKRREEIRDLMTKINKHQVLVDAIMSFNKVIEFSYFGLIDNNYRGSWFSKAKHSEIIDWLMGGRTIDERIEERTRNRVQQMQHQEDNESDGESDGATDEEFFDAETNEERRIDDRDIVIKFDGHHLLNSVLISEKSCHEKVLQLTESLMLLQQRTEEVNTYAIFDERGAKEVELQKAVDDLQYLKRRLDQYRLGNIPGKPHVIDYKSPATLTHNERWGLYFYWLGLLRHQLYEDISKLEGSYRKLYREYEEVKQIEDIHMLREMNVIGMTTTGAAKFQTLLHNLKCPIVIVEEAAEVLEAHVIASLTSDCKHLILIGDHQQLRPNTAEYRLAKEYNLEISLFERMIKNGIYCEQLQVQHRMRPEIASLIVPSIYPKLENHRTVETYPPVLGVTKNLFFLSHNEPEEAVGDSGSRRNVHEAKFLIRLARHFVLQGYEPTEITILAPYSGQMFCLMNERKSYPMLNDVRITVVDNFQGEENKLILLSLVRSNIDANIGFLKTDNRVCVALSRAKEGMYIMGNMDILQKSHNVWPKVKEVLSEHGSLDTHLTLKCQIHPDQLTEVKTAEDFLKVPEGGCTRICQKQLDCAHTCKSMCHVTDREHTKYKCKEPCSKILCEIGHKCPGYCFAICEPCMVLMMVTLKCGHNQKIPCYIQDAKDYKCPTMLDVTLECGHAAIKPCHRDIKTFPCPHVCEVRQECGHACIRKCHIHDDPDHLQSKCFKPCERYRKGCSDQIHKCPNACFQECVPCEVKVRKHRTICEHQYDIECNKDVDEIICQKPCKMKLDCGHVCPMKCFEECGNCKKPVSKQVEACGHTVRVACSVTPTSKNCKGNCPKLLHCGHKCTNKCDEQCTTRCEHLVANPHPVACGHVFEIPCYKTQRFYEPHSYKLLRHCTEKCTTLLKCEHECSGTCGECAQGRIHKSCQKDCGATLICGHPCDIPCRDTCQPCTRKCNYKCSHSKCGKKCGEPCSSCKEPCTRRCEHIRCTKTCGELCNVDPCSEPCPLRLKCGHPCIGFCGDTCPPVCRFCNADHETFETFFGDEDEPDARFIYLADCRHSIESDAIDQWLQQANGGEVNIKCCPRCKTPINKTQRFSDYIKRACKDIINIKKIWFGDKVKNEAKRVQLQLRATTIAHNNLKLYIQSKCLQSILKELKTTLAITVKGKRNVLHNSSLDTCTAQVQFIERLATIYTKSELEDQEKSKQDCIKIIDRLLRCIKVQQNRITDQEISDLELEVKRFEKFVQLCKIRKNPRFLAAIQQPMITALFEEITRNLNSIAQFTRDRELAVRSKLTKLCTMVDSTMRITEEERLMVVRAMSSSMGKGHWFKCPNGHYYTIGDCGGAMVEATCNECHAKIGGQSHTLLATNRFAGEMDGATSAAWSNAANMNMANYQF